jgi:predicted branched-subunit amino acid permease
MVIARFDGRPGAAGKFAYVLGNSIPVWLCWQITVGAGLAVGKQLPAAWKLEFAAPLAFIAMSIPLLRDRPMVAAAVSAGLTAVLAHALPLKLGLALAATVGIVIGAGFEGLLKVRAK